jgi:hypothetical protein
MPSAPRHSNTSRQDGRPDGHATGCDETSPDLSLVMPDAVSHTRNLAHLPRYLRAARQDDGALNCGTAKLSPGFGRGFWQMF